MGLFSAGTAVPLSMSRVPGWQCKREAPAAGGVRPAGASGPAAVGSEAAGIVSPAPPACLPAHPPGCVIYFLQQGSRLLPAAWWARVWRGVLANAGPPLLGAAERRALTEEAQAAQERGLPQGVALFLPEFPVRPPLGPSQLKVGAAFWTD